MPSAGLDRAISSSQAAADLRIRPDGHKDKLIGEKALLISCSLQLLSSQWRQEMITCSNLFRSTKSQRYNCFTRNAGNAIPKHAGPKAKGSNPTTGRTLLWALDPFRENFNHWQVSRKESNHEETSGYVRPERVNKWPNSMTDI